MAAGDRGWRRSLSCSRARRRKIPRVGEGLVTTRARERGGSLGMVDKEDKMVVDDALGVVWIRDNGLEMVNLKPSVLKLRN